MNATSRTPIAGLPKALVDRRRLVSALAGGALLSALRTPGLHAQTATPTSALTDVLATLSQALCGGGVFADGQLVQLSTLLSQDESLQSGFEQLTQDGTATPTPSARSAEAQAAAQAILLYWYTGTFKGEPVENHAAIYTQLQAWQAMYTPAWTTCKLYGAWADPPTMTPQQPENA